MSSERKIDPFAAIILLISIIGIILLATQYFMSFNLGAGNYRHSCLDCDYATALDLAAQIIVIILLIVQIIVALNDLIPKKLIEKDLSKIGLLIAILTVIWVLIGLISFGVTYMEYEWWPDTGFYAGIIAGIVNTVMSFLKYKNI